MRERWDDFLSDEDGQASTEYILVLMILVLASYGAIRLFITAWKSEFNKIKMLRSTPLP